jgi:hypothetical protein
MLPKNILLYKNNEYNKVKIKLNVDKNTINVEYCKIPYVNKNSPIKLNVPGNPKLDKI